MNEESNFRFIGLDPRKVKKAKIEASLAGQTIEWRRLPGLRWGDYPESPKRAEAALQAARSVPAAPWNRAAKRLMLRLQYNWCRNFFERRKTQGMPVALVWNGLNGTRRVWGDAAKDAGCKTLFFELGPFPNTLTVDPAGVNYANALPRAAQPYLTWLHSHPDQSGSWRPVAAQISQRRPVGKSEPPEGAAPPLSENFIFVPLQFQGDSQLRLFGGQCRTVEATIDHVCQAARSLPAGWHIRLKEHPSDTRSFAAHLSEAAAGLPVYLDNQTDTFQQVRAAQAVCTVNSSVGLEALMLGKPVIAMGQAYWAVPGLVAKGQGADELAAIFTTPERLKVDERLRDAFLSFLVSEYYPRLTVSEGRWSMSERCRARVLGRLQRSFPMSDTRPVEAEAANTPRN